MKTSIKEFVNNHNGIFIFGITAVAVIVMLVLLYCVPSIPEKTFLLASAGVILSVGMMGVVSLMD